MPHRRSCRSTRRERLVAALLLRVQRREVLREALAQPLLVVVAPADRLSPPLVRELVGDEEIGIVCERRRIVAPHQPRSDCQIIETYLDPYRMITIQGLVLPARGEYYLLMSSEGDEGANNSLVFIYDLKSDRWFTDTYVGISAIGKINQTLAPSFFSPRQHESPEFIVAGDTVDHVYLEKSYQDTETVTTANVGFTTQDFFALNSQDVPDMNAKNEFLALTFRTHPLTTLNVSLSIDKGMSYIGPMVVTANAQGLALYNFMVSFSHIRFTFSQRTTQFPLMVEGPLSMEWERSGDTY